MNHLKNDRGLTLVELLATIVLTVLIGMLAYAVLFSGFNTYDRVKIESALRDEADIIMAEMINDLFTLRTSDIKEKHLSENDSNNYFFKLKDADKIIGFLNGEVYLNGDSTKVLQNDLINLGSDSYITDLESGLFRIFLTLEWAENSQSITTETEISLINDEE